MSVGRRRTPTRVDPSRCIIAVAAYATLLSGAGFHLGLPQCWVGGFPLKLVPFCQRAHPKVHRFADGLGEPLDQQRNPARYIDPPDPRGKEVAPSGDEGVSVLPLFPLGDSAYFPDSKHTLNIFEPRYRQLYDDILFSGSRRFVVTSVNRVTGQFAEVGVVFYINDLQEVSEQTGDQVKYVCEHSVIGRVQIKRYLNPAAWTDASSYLRVETIPVEDVDDDQAHENEAELEKAVAAEMESVSDLQDPKEKLGYFTEQIKGPFQNLSRSSAPSLWSIVERWVYYLQLRTQTRQEIFQQEIENLIEVYKNENEEDFQSRVRAQGNRRVISYQDLPSELQAALHGIQEQFNEDMIPLIRQRTEYVQKLLQSVSRRERLQTLLDEIGTERRRLAAQKAVRSLMSDLEAGEGDKADTSV